MNRRWQAGAGILEGSALAGVPDILWEQRGELCANGVTRDAGCPAEDFEPDLGGTGGPGRALHRGHLRPCSSDFAAAAQRCEQCQSQVQVHARNPQIPGNSCPGPHPTPQFSPHTLCFGPWKSPQQGKKRLVFRGLRTGLRAGWEIKDGSAFLFRALPWERRGPRGEGGGVFRHLNRLQRTRLERSPSSRLHQPHAAERRLPGRAPPRRAAAPPLPAAWPAACPPGAQGRLLFRDGLRLAEAGSPGLCVSSHHHRYASRSPRGVLSPPLPLGSALAHFPCPQVKARSGGRTCPGLEHGWWLCCD